MSIAIAPPLSRKRIVAIADIIRRLIKCETAFFDIIALIEFVIPQIDPTFYYEIVSEDSLKGVYAYYDPLKNSIVISASVYERACAGVGRDRFTLAHEVGHYFLHHDGYLYARSTQKIPKYRDPEWQANTFASALLIPRELVMFMSASEIQNKCKVSYQAAKIACDSNWQ